jgi:hypothetical protein
LKPFPVALAAILGIGSVGRLAAARDESAGPGSTAANDPAPSPSTSAPSAPTPSAPEAPSAPSNDPAPPSAPSNDPAPPSDPPSAPTEAPKMDSPLPSEAPRDTSIVPVSPSVGATPAAQPAGEGVIPAPRDQASARARASQEQAVDEATTDSTSDSWKTDPNQKTTLPWHGSMILFDQSVTTPTIGVGASYLSADPTYEWWLALKPRYAIYESRLESFSVSVWANLYLEVTNSDSTTTEHEPVIGPTWVTASYGRTLFENAGYKTSMNIGPRFAIPTDKASRTTGQILGLGASFGLSQRIPLNGESAPIWDALRFGLSATYNHPIARSTTATGPGQPGQTLGNPVEDLGNGRTTGVQGTSGGTEPTSQDQLSGGLITRHALTIAVSGDLQITPKLGFSLAYSLINRWGYSPTEMTVCILTGCVDPITVDSPTTFRPSNWLTASIDYDLFDEVGLSFGYYNQALQLGPDGQRRGVLWSPDARFFLTVTGNLDAIYESLTKKPEPVTAHR